MEQKDHFEKIYLYVCATSLLVLIYVISITFFEIPEKNQRFVDISLAFLLGFISSNSSYLTGGNPLQQKKTETPSGTTTTADIQVTQTVPETKPNE